MELQDLNSHPGYILRLAQNLRPEELRGYNVATLSLPVTQEILQAKVIQLEMEKGVGEAKDFVDAIGLLLKEKISSKGDAALAESYKTLEELFSWVAFPVMVEEKQQYLFGKSLLFALRWGIEAKEKLRMIRNAYYIDDEMIGKLYGKLLQGLAENREQLGSNKLVLKGNSEQVIPSLQNWIADYNFFTAGKADRSHLDEVAYVSQNINAQRCSAQDKQRLLDVLELFDMLRSPMLAQAGVETVRVAPIPPAPASITPRPAQVPLAPAFHPPQKTPFKSPVPPRPQAGAERKFFSMDTERPNKQFKTPPAPPVRPVTAPVSAAPSSTQGGAAAQQLQKLVHEANFREPVSLSQAIVNADMVAGGQTGDIRIGKQEYATGKFDSKVVSAKGDNPAPLQPLKKENPAPTAPAAAKPNNSITPQATLPAQKSLQERTVDFKAALVRPPAPVRPAVSVPQSVPANPEKDFVNQLREQAQAPKPAMGFNPTVPKPASGVVDLAKKVPLDLQSISTITDLQKVQLGDIPEQSFDAGLNVIKQKIISIAQTAGIPVKTAVNSFYRSPLFNLYVSMAVAVMNDAGADQKMAFDKVMANYQTARKESLSREEFLSMNRLKKELAGLS